MSDPIFWIRDNLWFYGISTSKYDSYNNKYNSLCKMIEKVEKKFKNYTDYREYYDQYISSIKSHHDNYDSGNEGHWMDFYVEKRDEWESAESALTTKLNYGKWNTETALSNAKTKRDQYLSYRNTEEANLRAALEAAREAERQRILAELEAAKNTVTGVFK